MRGSCDNRRLSEGKHLPSISYLTHHELKVQVLPCECPWTESGSVCKFEAVDHISNAEGPPESTSMSTMIASRSGATATRILVVFEDAARIQLGLVCGVLR